MPVWWWCKTGGAASLPLVNALRVGPKKHMLSLPHPHLASLPGNFLEILMKIRTILVSIKLDQFYCSTLAHTYCGVVAILMACMDFHSLTMKWILTDNVISMCWQLIPALLILLCAVCLFCVRSKRIYRDNA